MADDREDERQVLDYGVEKPPALRRRDSIEYYREPPALGRLSASEIVIWIISFLLVGFLALWLIGRWFDAAWN